jgi:hypothetical protein
VVDVLRGLVLLSARVDEGLGPDDHRGGGAA